MMTSSHLATALKTRVSDDAQAAATLTTIPHAPSRELRDQVAFFHLLSEVDTSMSNGNYQGFLYIRAVEIANRRRCSLLELTLGDMLEASQIAHDDFQALMSGTADFSYDDLIEFAEWWEDISQ